MKAADYRIPWGRPSEHLLAVKREVIGQQLHLRRVEDARNRSTIDTEPPECADMPHLISRPKKKKMQEDRQREIAAENCSLMHRLAGIMKEERRDPVRKFAHLSVEYRESLRRKKLLKLETENRRLARSIREQRPFYPNRVMEKEEEERQALLKIMSRTERRYERIASFKASSDHGNNSNSPGRIRREQSAAAMTASLVEDGVLFRPGPTAIRLRTAKQMQLAVARRRQGGNGDGGGGNGVDAPDYHLSSGTGGEAGEGGTAQGLHPSSTTTAGGSLVLKRRAYSSDGTAATAGRAGGLVLEVNRTGGGGGGGGGGRGGGRRRSVPGAGEGRPNMIFTPSLAPVGMESVRSCPMSLGSGGLGHTSSVRWAPETMESAVTTEDSLEEGGGKGMLQALRDTRTV
ncbi:unnamed protein product [Ectocarpus sp. 12 AP-2014]